MIKITICGQKIYPDNLKNLFGEQFIEENLFLPEYNKFVIEAVPKHQ